MWNIRHKFSVEVRVRYEEFAGATQTKKLMKSKTSQESYICKVSKPEGTRRTAVRYKNRRKWKGEKVAQNEVQRKKGPDAIRSSKPFKNSRPILSALINY